MNFKQVKINETQHWNKEFLKRHNLKKMLGVYVFNSNEATHCCELTPSYCLYFIRTEYEFEVYPEDDIREDIDLEIIESDNNMDQTIYMHCRNVDKISDIIDLGEFDNIDEAIEEANANWR